MNLWNNLLKCFLVRLWTGSGEAVSSAYRLCVRMLRKLSPWGIRLSWLQRLINALLPCPQMVQRYINPSLSLEDFFAILNKREIRYVVLRWFEHLPNLKEGDDIDMLLDDADVAKIKDLFVVLPTGTPCDIYTVSALPGASYRSGVPLYPSHLAREILATSVMYNRTCRVPDPRRHFFSLAYHVVYHKPEQSGLVASKDEPAASTGGEGSYAETLVSLAENIGLKILPDRQNLREVLTEHGWAPRLDVLRRIAAGSPSLSFLASAATEQLLPKESLRRCFDVHGVRLLVESNCTTFMEYVWRDFCFFHNVKEDHGRPHIHVTFLNMSPPWEEIPRFAVPLYKTAGSTVYKQGGNRYVDHDREVLAIYDLERDEGTFYSNNPDAMYRIAYAMLMTRVGLRLDGMRRHRMHALGIAVDKKAFLLLGDGGCGKSTLGFEMMKHSQIGWLTDDILPVDSNGRALAFPTSPRLIKGSAVPWLPPSVNLLKSPMPKRPPKVQLPSWTILPRVCSSAKLGGLFLCRRRPGVGPSIRRVDFFQAFYGLCDNALTGRHFGHMKAYHLQFSPSYIYKMSWIYLSRVRNFMYLAWTVPVFRFDMGGQVSENASLLLNNWPTGREQRNRSPLASLNAIPSVESPEFRKQSRSRQ